MFESETIAIQEKLKDTLAIYDKMAALHNEYWNAKNDKYFYFSERIEGRHIVYTRALEALKRLVECEAGIKCNFDAQAHNNFADPEVLEAVKKVNNISTDDVLNHFAYCLTPYRYNNEAKYKIKNDIVEISLCHTYCLRLVLNVLNILINGQIETREIYEKSKEALKNDKTFIYRDVKITCYENGKIKLVFAKKDILDKMVILLGTVRSSKDE